MGYNPACPRCFDLAADNDAFECVAITDAVSKTEWSLTTWNRWASRGRCLAKRVAGGTGKWLVLLTKRGLPVDPPSCPHAPPTSVAPGSP